MKELNLIAFDLFSLGLGSLRGLSLGDYALIIAWILVMILYVAGQGLRFPRKRRLKNREGRSWKIRARPTLVCSSGSIIRHSIAMSRTYGPSLRQIQRRLIQTIQNAGEKQ